jgi:hypothetical protein
MARFINSIQKTVTITDAGPTAYDVVGGLLTFSNAVREKGGSAYVRSVKLAGVVAVAYTLWLLNADIVTTAADDAPFTIVVADELKYLGHILIPAANYVAAQSAFNVCTVRNVNLMVKAAATTQDIYGYLVAPVTDPDTTTIYLTVDFEPI